MHLSFWLNLIALFAVPTCNNPTLMPSITYSVLRHNYPLLYEGTWRLSNRSPIHYPLRCCSLLTPMLVVFGPEIRSHGFLSSSCKLIPSIVLRLSIPPVLRKKPYLRFVLVSYILSYHSINLSTPNISTYQHPTYQPINTQHINLSTYQPIHISTTHYASMLA